MRNNSKMIKAQRSKKDEFYTQYETIAKEIPYYKKFLKNKNIYCNCDDPRHSAFWKYFVENFDEYSLRSVVSTYYSDNEPVYKTTLEREIDGALKRTRVPVRGNGDYSSPEMQEILDAPDTIVITNPPFSETKNFIPLMYRHNVKFLILGNQNTLTFRDIYPHVLAGDLFLGVSIHSGDVNFEIPANYELDGMNAFEKNGKKYAKVTGIRWFTNMDHGCYPEKIELKTKSWNLRNNKKLISKLISLYGIKQYPVYDNYPAIEVPVSNGIPSDYSGVVGVPITFFDKYNPNQFRFVGFRKGNDGKDLRVKDKETYFRFLVQNMEAA